MNDDVKATKVDLFYKNIQAIIGMLTERGMKAEASIASGGTLSWGKGVYTHWFKK